jgi:multidrug efflux pump subunit AcrA (membrane-fusion protein)
MLFSLIHKLPARIRLSVLLIYPLACQFCTGGSGAVSAESDQFTDSSFTSRLNDTIRVTTRSCIPEDFIYTIQAYGKLRVLVSGGALRAFVGILESDFRYIKLGQPATVRILGTADEVQGQVTDIGKHVDDNGIIDVSIKLNNQHDLLPGMNVVASIRNSIPNRLIVPREAVIVHGDSTVVFTISEGKSNWNYVTLGKDNGHEVEVLRGLKPGDKVIISNNIELTQDSPVKE